MAWMTFNITHQGSSTTVSLVDGINCNLVSWAPSVSRERSDLLAGTSKYIPVTERVIVNLFGADSLETYETLSWILDKAGRVGEVVTLGIQLQNSVLSAVVESQILGTASGAPLKAAAAFNSLLMVYEINGLTLNFTRQGLYLGAINTVAVTAVANPAVLIATMAEELDVIGPTKITVDLDEDVSAPMAGYVVVSDYHTDKITIVDSDDMTAAGSSTISDTANYALGDNVKRFAADAVYEASYSFPSRLTGFDSMAILAVVKNISTTNAFRLTAGVESDGLVAYTRSEILDTSTTDARVVSFGVLTMPSGRWDKVLLKIDYNQYSATEYMYLDYMVCVPFGPNTQIVPMVEQISRTIGSSAKVVLDHRALTAKSALATFESGTDQTHLSAESYAYIETSGEKIAVVFACPDGAKWKTLDAAGTGVLDVGFTAVRHKSYLVPQ